jgi:hypothetical protein
MQSLTLHPYLELQPVVQEERGSAGKVGEGLRGLQGAPAAPQPQSVPNQARGLELDQDPPDAQDAPLRSLSQRQRTQ